MKLFAYYLCVDEKETDCTPIRIYGVNEHRETICIRIDDFYQYCYVELPYVPKDEHETKTIADALTDCCAPKKKPWMSTFVMRKKLYYASIEKGERKQYPCIRFSFKHSDHRRAFYYKFKEPMRIAGKLMKFIVHEHDVNVILQLTSNKKISTAGWIDFSGTLVPESDKLTSCDKEYIVSQKKLAPTPVDMSLGVGKVQCLSFDLEVNSSIPSAMPLATRSKDRVFQISCVLWRYGDRNENVRKVLLTLGKPLREFVDGEIINFDTEGELIVGFTEFIKENKVNVIMGYNIFGFDMPYLIARSKFCHIPREFNMMGYLNDVEGVEKEIKWSSSAYKNQIYHYLDVEGRMFIDIQPIIQRDYRLDNYKLKTVSAKFLGQTKDPLTPQGIFKCYAMGMDAEKDGVSEEVRMKGRRALSIVGKYCLQDSYLVLRLFQVLNIWTGLIEMGSVCNVSMFTTFTQGQQVRVFSQLYKKCVADGIVVDSSSYIPKENDMYVGASVHQPTKHYHKNVLPFDFTSLYPTCIIAYNICWSTLVQDFGSRESKDKTISDDACHVMEWDDHVNCDHDPKVVKKVELDMKIETENIKLKAMREASKKMKGDDLVFIKQKIASFVEKLKPLQKERSAIVKTIGKRVLCSHRYFRWLKSPIGILPSIALNLLDSRKNTKTEMKNVKNKMKNFNEYSDEWNKLNTYFNVLDARQLSLKVSCNSLYGALGVHRGYVPLMAGAMSTTYQGREAIKLAISHLTSKYGGELAHSDTDSAYCSFPFLKTAQECWNFAHKIAEEISKEYPKPMAILFEEHIYEKFLIITKKRYMSIDIDKDGNHKLDENGNIEMNKKGVLLTRRDNCNFVRSVYANVVMKIFADTPAMIEDIEIENDEHNTYTYKTRVIKIEKKGKPFTKLVDFKLDDILYYLINEMNRLCSGGFELEMFRTTKSVGDIGNLKTPVKGINEKTKKEEWRMGNYVIKPLLPETLKEQLESKNATTVEEYYLNSLPAQCVLAQKMRVDRGQLVAISERVEFVIIEVQGRKKTTQRDTIESYHYVKRNREFVKIDYLHYLHKLAIPMDQILELVFGNTYAKFCLNQYELRVQKKKITTEINGFGAYKLVEIEK